MRTTAAQLQKEDPNSVLNLPKRFPKLQYMSPGQVRINPDYMAMNHIMNPKDRQVLLEDIRKNGFMSPLTVNEKGVLLDGFHRWGIAKQLGGVKFPVVVISFKNKAEEKYYVEVINMIRRQVKPMELARKLKEYYPDIFNKIDIVKTRDQKQGLLTEFVSRLPGVQPSVLKKAMVKHSRAARIARESGRAEPIQADYDKAEETGTSKALARAIKIKYRDTQIKETVKILTKMTGRILVDDKKQMAYESVQQLQPVAQKMLLACNKRIAKGK